MTRKVFSLLFYAVMTVLCIIGSLQTDVNLWLRLIYVGFAIGFVNLCYDSSKDLMKKNKNHG